MDNFESCESWCEPTSMNWEVVVLHSHEGSSKPGAVGQAAFLRWIGQQGVELVKVFGSLLVVACQQDCARKIHRFFCMRDYEPRSETVVSPHRSARRSTAVQPLQGNIGPQGGQSEWGRRMFWHSAVIHGWIGLSTKPFRVQWTLYGGRWFGPCSSVAAELNLLAARFMPKLAPHARL